MLMSLIRPALIKAMKRLSILALGSATLFGTTPVLAGSYQAICGGTKCTVIVGAGEIRSPMGSIPPERVTDWGGGGNSKTSIGTGVATTVLLGPIGLLGFMAKNHVFNFVVNGYDRQGRRTSLDIQFKNDKPSKRFIEEMQRLTGLGMGQIRTAQDIKNSSLVSQVLERSQFWENRLSSLTYKPEIKQILIKGQNSYNQGTS